MITPEYNLPKVIFIDLDQTLLEAIIGKEWTGESWLLVTTVLGASREKHMQIYNDYRHRLSGNEEEDLRLHDEMVKKILKLWQDAANTPRAGGQKIGTLTRSKIDKICKLFIQQVSEDAIRVMKAFIKQDIMPIISTGGLAIVAEVIAEEIGVKEAMVGTAIDGINASIGNSELIFNGADELVGFKHSPNIAETKKIQIEEKIAEISKLTGAQAILTIAAGDGSSDGEVFKIMPGIAVNATDQDLIDLAAEQVNSWDGLLAATIIRFDQMENEDKYPPATASIKV
jgi:phosphoserine phosphatase